MSETLAIPPHLQKYLLDGCWKAAPDEHKNEFTQLFCEHAGISAISRPIQWLFLNGKLQPYAAKDCTDQLRRVNEISLSVVGRDYSPDGSVYIVTCQARAKSGRYDESTGAVSLLEPEKIRVEGRWQDNPRAGQLLRGDDRVNAIMKAETKAKRRVTLSLCGLGMLDESEIETIADATLAPVAAQPAKQPAQEQIEATKPVQKAPAGKPAKPATIHHSVSNSLASNPSLHTVEGNCNKKGQTLEAIEAEDPAWFEKALRPANRKKLTELDVLMIDDFLRLRAAGHEPFAKDSIPF